MKNHWKNIWKSIKYFYYYFFILKFNLSFYMEYIVSLKIFLFGKVYFSFQEVDEYTFPIFLTHLEMLLWVTPYCLWFSGKTFFNPPISIESYYYSIQIINISSFAHKWHTLRIRSEHSDFTSYFCPALSEIQIYYEKWIRIFAPNCPKNPKFEPWNPIQSKKSQIT